MVGGKAAGAAAAGLTATASDRASWALAPAVGPIATTGRPAPTETRAGDTAGGVADPLEPGCPSAAADGIGIAGGNAGVCPATARAGVCG
jgi:hypothetical protein